MDPADRQRAGLVPGVIEHRQRQIDARHRQPELRQRDRQESGPAGQIEYRAAGLGRQSFEEQAKPGSSTVRADPTIDTKSKGAGKPPTKSKEGLVNPTLQDNQAPASELAPPVEEEEVQPPTKIAAKKAVEGERKQQRGQERAREKEAK